MSTKTREQWKKIVGDGIEKFRKQYGTTGSAQDLLDGILRDPASRGYDADDLKEIEDLLDVAEVHYDINVWFPDDVPAGPIMG